MRNVVVVGYPDAALLEIACTTEVFDFANRAVERPSYRVGLAGVEEGPMRCSSGLSLLAAQRIDRLDGPLDTLIVAGGPGSRWVTTHGPTLTHIRRLAASSRRIVSICSGAFVLAAAGLLDGKRATTHWEYAADLARMYPLVTVDPAPLFIKDGAVYTAAGVTSALDVTLALIEEDHGPTLARDIAKSLVVYLQRPGNQAQISMYVAASPPNHRVVGDLVGHITGHIDADLSAPTLADRVGLSARQLTRLFDTHLGTTPSRYVRAMRTKAAAELLAGTDLPLTAVARRCGFGSTETLRQAFLDHFATPPSAYRRTSRRNERG
ncbi:GlxA family transcriptional regulator [Nocardia brasiliensis]|uniref:AraC family transcriptional regulator n=1 Tax=Nocardia brasiliensis (strain ATCC 700358 / HUJEG-1) TaxID=1133849 RepID=K0F5M9_NOCB7|nr:GlxA family transcriptional regulator [Nocardia brasiliensis]AFU04640.1 AraC family transcriptional regulator [Nocardia brasiliensis ATCC 700358]OCF88376.1 AraC family transcriptional regulator [Nocardia brasiliensis]